MLWIWYSKHFSLSANAWIKSVTSQRLSLGFLPRYAGTSYIRFAATRSIQKCSFFPMLMIFTPKILRFGDPWMSETFEIRFWKSTKSTGWRWSFFIWTTYRTGKLLMLSEYRSAQSCRGCPEAKRSLNRSSLTPHGIEGIQFPLIIWARKWKGMPIRSFLATQASRNKTNNTPTYKERFIYD